MEPPTPQRHVPPKPGNFSPGRPHCGPTDHTDSWAALGYDKGTTVGKTPPVDEIIGMAKAILRM